MLQPIRGRRTQVKHVTGLTGLDEALRHNWYQSKAPVPSVIGEAVPVAPVPPLPGVQVSFVAPVPPSPPMIAAEEPVVQVERFLRLQPPTYIGGPNPDTVEHWIHEIESVDTPIDGVDTGSTSLKLFHEDRVKCADTVPSTVDTRPSP
ncbi:hypothetical protein Taro_049593 [Colocasia esculenta]|uniref:Uncharacterized protein n=1 Tax=Colocasia esculenta TaxID=4460 RepID=A0A843XB61_COLES|nr:hypothetical protein [Colocasia esculenta]